MSREVQNVNREAFDQVSKSILSCSSEELKMTPVDWQKFDKPCPPGSFYVYAVQCLGDVKNKMVLDFCCGDGYLSVILAKRGAKVTSFDISRNSLKATVRRAVANNMEGAINVQEMSAMALAYGDETFDLVIGLSVLQYLDISMAANEIVRVLKKGGKAVFAEPFNGSNVLQGMVQIGKKLFPDRFRVCASHITVKDIHTLKQRFAGISLKEFGLFSRLDRILRFVRFKQLLNRADEKLLVSIPFLKRYARRVVIELIK